MDTTILIPARIRNEEELGWLKEAFKSAEGQGEILIAYNQCTVPKLPRFAKKAKVFDIDAKNLAQVRNFLVPQVKTPYYFFLDADDILPEGAIGAMEEFMKTLPKQRYIYGKTLLFGGGRLEVPAQDFDCKKLTQGVYFPNGVLQQTENYEIVGPWDESLSVLEDKDWWLTATEKAVCGIPLKTVMTYQYRQRPGGMVSLARQNSVLWRENLEYIKNKHRDFYNGVYPMGCGCGSKKTVISSQSAIVTQSAQAQTLLPAPAGYTALHFTLGTARTNYYGPVTGTKYTVSARNPDIYVKDEDLQTTTKSRPGLLQIRKNLLPVFKVIKE